MSERVRFEIERLLILITLSSIDFETIKKFIIQFQSRSMSDPTISDIDFKDKMALVHPLKKIFELILMQHFLLELLNEILKLETAKFYVR